VLERASRRPQVPLPSEQISIEDGLRSCSRGCRKPRLRLRGPVRGRVVEAGLIVTFLALLEMIRLKLVRVFQAGQLGPIRIYKRPQPAGAPGVVREDSDRAR